MHRECRGCIFRHRLQREPLVSDPVMHHGTCVTWCMSGLVTRGGGENVPGIPGACATCNFTYLARGSGTYIFQILSYSIQVCRSSRRGNDMCNLVLFEFSRIYPNHAGQLRTTMIVMMMMMMMMMAMMIMVMNEKRNDVYNDSNDNDSNNSKNDNDNDIQ